MMQYSVVVPCYNEADNIPLILNRFQEITSENMEVILVDNGSTDSSAEILAKLLPQYPFARTVRVDVNQGYGYGILQGLECAKGENIGWTHADMQTDPKDVIKAFEVLERSDSNALSFVKGTRKGRSLFDRFFTIGMSLFETLYMRCWLWDINAQPNVFPKSFFQTWKNPPHDFSLDLYALYMAKQNGLDVLRFNVVFPPRIHGKSSWNTGMGAKWKFIKRTVSFSRELKNRGIS